MVHIRPTTTTYKHCKSKSLDWILCVELFIHSFIHSPGKWIVHSIISLNILFCVSHCFNHILLMYFSEDGTTVFVCCSLALIIPIPILQDLQFATKHSLRYHFILVYCCFFHNYLSFLSYNCDAFSVGSAAFGYRRSLTDCNTTFKNENPITWIKLSVIIIDFINRNRRHTNYIFKMTTGWK